MNGHGDGEEAAPEQACLWCGRARQEFRPCCEQHPDRVVCRDTAGCTEYSLAQDNEINRRLGLA